MRYNHFRRVWLDIGLTGAKIEVFSGRPKEKIIYKQIQDVFKAIRGEEETDHIFEKIIDRDLDGLVSRFRLDLPNQKEIDYLMFCYIVAGFDAKTISIILSDMSVDSVNMRKSRLKKRIINSDINDKEKYLKYF